VLTVATGPGGSAGRPGYGPTDLLVALAPQYRIRIRLGGVGIGWCPCWRIGVCAVLAGFSFYLAIANGARCLPHLDGVHEHSTCGGSG
jgi:hypothetical protein